MNNLMKSSKTCCNASKFLKLSSPGNALFMLPRMIQPQYAVMRHSRRHAHQLSRLSPPCYCLQSVLHSIKLGGTSRTVVFSRTGQLTNRLRMSTKTMNQNLYPRSNSFMSITRTTGCLSHQPSLIWTIFSKNCSTKSATENVQRIMPKVSDLSRLLSLAKPEKWRLVAAVGLLLISSAVTMAVPFGIGRVIDIIYTQERDDMMQNLKSFCKVLLLVFVTGAVANVGRVYLMKTSGQHIIKRIRQQLFGSIVTQEIAFFDQTKTGELINRLSADTSLVGQSLTTNISDGLRAVAQACGGVGMMFYVSPKLAVIGLSIVPPVALIAIIYGRYVRSITRKVQDALADSTQVAEERLANMRTVRAFVQEQREYERYNAKIDKVLQLSYKEALASGIFFGCTGLSGNMIILSVIYQGGVEMNQAMITVGELSSFLMYAAYVGVAIGGLSSFYTDLMKGLGASSRLWELIDRKPAIPVTGGVIPSLPFQGCITFEDIHFSYPMRSDTPVCQGLSLSVPQGTVLAVVGASGSGKSTLASLLLRYYDPDCGQITVDGIDIKKLSVEWLRNNMGLVSQEPTLFSCSIAENIAYGAVEPAKVTPEEIVEAAKKANAYNFIQSFPSGMETMVGERGVMLSGGQKQRIAIARAILKNPKILLLDEATSALDAEIQQGRESE